MTTLPRLLPVNAEFLSLCQKQLQLLAQGLGAEWGIVYLAQPDRQSQEMELTPISVFPAMFLGEGLVRQGQDQEMVAELVDVDLSTGRGDPLEDVRGYLDRPSTAFPLLHEDLILGILTTGRKDRAWRSPEIAQIELVAQSLVWACVLDQQKSWATQRLAQQQALQGLEHEHFHDLLHQLRNPTMAISTFGKLLLKRLLPEEKNYPVAEGIVRESDRLKGLLTQFSEEVDLLEAAMPLLDNTPNLALPPENMSENLATLKGYGKQSLVLEPLDLREVILPLVASMVAIASEKNIVLNHSLAENLPLVLGHKNALMEVLNNLLENAIKYTPEGGQIWLQVLNENQAVTIAVHDTGYGIPATDQAHIFERHYRGVQSEGDIQGTGLGLAIAHELVEKLEGDLEVYSPTIGLPHTASCPGSTFILWLKVA